MNSTRKRLAAIAVCLVATLGIMTPASASSQHKMTVHRAGRYYLHTVCPDNRADDTFARKIWHGRTYIHAPEVKRRLHQIRQLSRMVSNAHYKASKRMYHPPAAWPSNVEYPITKMAVALSKQSRWASAMANSTTARQWLRNLRHYNQVSFGQLAYTIRARLSLPSPGHGC